MVPTPIRPLPERIARWTTRARWLRWVDALVAWIVVEGLVVAMLSGLPPGGPVAIAGTLVAVLGLIPPIRRGWRPASGLVGLRLSRTLVPGDRAWYLRPGAADLVIVTGRQGLRLTIAAPGRGAAEGMSVRRSRVLLLSADERDRRATPP